MDAGELRQKFLNYFQEKGHVVLPASSLIPDDPSVLFTTAGMQQFKPYYTGDLDPLTAIHPGLKKPLGSRRAVSVQKCVRTSDIEEVGDATHLTFFEMLGNFSFGDYFKEEAIAWAKEFVLGVLGLHEGKLWYAVFGGDGVVLKDAESRKILQELGTPSGHIAAFGRKENFWGPTGEEGPCGPTVEMHYDRTGRPCDRGNACQPNCPCGRFLEIWNLVFNEYYQKRGGSLEKLKIPGVDTGAGLERMLLALENRTSVFETSVFQPLIESLLPDRGFPTPPVLDAFERLWSAGSGVLRIIEEQGEQANLIRSVRVIADHLRAAAFLIADGVYPSNLERGYVVRRLIRRAVRAARAARLSEQWWQNGLFALRAIFEEPYPEIIHQEVAPTIKEEIEKFSKTLERGLREFEKRMEHVSGGSRLSGQDVFDLYETYGFPLELVEELAAERGVAVDREGFETARHEHQEVSRAGQEKKFGGHGLILDTGELRAATEEELKRVTRLHTATHLLQAALRKVLGPQVKQMGSDITAERLRFDFTFSRKVRQEELAEIERIVNEKIRSDLAVDRADMTFEEAIAQGALAFFKAKYPPNVHVYSIGDPSSGSGRAFSKEVCGGPHVTHTAEVGKFTILKEEASSAGIRRIRATVEPR